MNTWQFFLWPRFIICRSFKKKKRSSWADCILLWFFTNNTKVQHKASHRLGWHTFLTVTHWHIQMVFCIAPYPETSEAFMCWTVIALAAVCPTRVKFFFFSATDFKCKCWQWLHLHFCQFSDLILNKLTFSARHFLSVTSTRRLYSKRTTFRMRCGGIG